VRSLALFGSVGRGEASGSSDVDLLVEYDRPITLFDLAATMMRLEEILGVAKVDLVLRDSLLEELRGPILAEAVDV
jgi:predicted nucleotidyltransferase